jgi:Domain of unknown function (DUF5679)
MRLSLALQALACACRKVSRSAPGARTVVRGHDPSPTEAETDREEATMAETYQGDAYCVKCKQKRDFEGEVVVSESGRRMAKGTCPVCGTKLNRILGKA